MEFELKNRKQTTFEFGQNLLEVQTSFEKSDKFPKILICLDLPECEFRLAWLYGKNCSSIQASFDLV
jgi:hypothetical protein